MFEVMLRVSDGACRRETLCDFQVKTFGMAKIPRLKLGLLHLNAAQIGILSRESPHAAQEEWHRERTLPEAKATAAALPLR